MITKRDIINRKFKEPLINNLKEFSDRYGGINVIDEDEKISVFWRRPQIFAQYNFKENHYLYGIAEMDLKPFDKNAEINIKIVEHFYNINFIDHDDFIAANIEEIEYKSKVDWVVQLMKDPESILEKITNSYKTLINIINSNPRLEYLLENKLLGFMLSLTVNEEK